MTQVWWGKPIIHLSFCGQGFKVIFGYTESWKPACLKTTTKTSAKATASYSVCRQGGNCASLAVLLQLGA